MARPKDPETALILERARDQSRWGKFVHHYMQDYNATAAYARAFNAHTMSASRRAVEAQRLLTHPLIAQEIERLSQARITLADVTLERVTIELARVAFSDIGQAVQKQQIAGVDGTLIDVELPIEIGSMPEDTRRAVREVTFNKQGATIKMADKQAALETLAKMLMLANGHSPQGRDRTTRALKEAGARDHDAVSDDEIALMLAEAEEDSREPDDVLDPEDDDA